MSIFNHGHTEGVMSMPDTATNDIYQIIGQRLREARQQNRWTRQQLAEKLAEYTGHEYGTATIRRWEIGERNVDMSDMWALTRSFGLGLDYWLAPISTDDTIGGYKAIYEVETMLSPTHDRGRAAWTAIGAPIDVITSIYGTQERSEKLAALDGRTTQSKPSEVPPTAVEVESRTVDGVTYMIPKESN